MVCLGNICRSPLAEGILQHKIKERGLNWTVDSAGTSGYHSGSKPDSRSILVASKNGINIDRQRSRTVKNDDFNNFDLVLAMDSSNYTDLKRRKPGGSKAEIELIMNYFDPGRNINVPDPYYRDGGFDDVYQMLENAIDSLINKINK